MFDQPAPKGLFPPEPEHYRGPKLKVAIVGAGLAGMSTAVELLDQGHEVWLTYPYFLARSQFLRNVLYLQCISSLFQEMAMSMLSFP